MEAEGNGLAVWGANTGQSNSSNTMCVYHSLRFPDYYPVPPIPGLSWLCFKTVEQLAWFLLVLPSAKCSWTLSPTIFSPPTLGSGVVNVILKSLGHVLVSRLSFPEQTAVLKECFLLDYPEERDLLISINLSGLHKWAKKKNQIKDTRLLFPNQFSQS